MQPLHEENIHITINKLPNNEQDFIYSAHGVLVH